MKKWIGAFFICMSFFITTAFENADQLQITNVKTTVDEEKRLLRYDLQLFNEGNTPIKSEFDYPGHQYYGIEMVIRPKEELAKLMVLEQNSTYTKMVPVEHGWKEYFEPGEKAPFYISYKIKKDADLEQVKKNALKSELLLLDGISISKTISLEKVKENIDPTE